MVLSARKRGEGGIIKTYIVYDKATLIPLSVGEALNTEMARCHTCVEYNEAIVEEVNFEKHIPTFDEWLSED